MTRMKEALWVASTLVAAVFSLCAAPQDAAKLQELYSKGGQAVRDKDFIAAEQAFRAGLETAQALGDKGWIAKMRQSLGETHEARRQWKDAVAEYAQALALFEELGQKPQAAFLMRLGLACTNLSDYAKAAGYLSRAQAGFLEASDGINAAKALDTLGQVQARIPDFAAAESALTRALALYEKAEDFKGAAKVRGSLSDLYRRRSQFSQALENGFRALDEDERFGDHREAAKVLDVLGNAFQQMGQADNALRYYQRALDSRKKFDLKQDLPFSYRNIGASLGELGRNAEALEYYGMSLELAKAADSTREITDCKLNIGTSELSLGHIDKAKESLQEALETAEKYSYRPQAGIALYTLGNLFQTSGDLDRALEFHQRALKLREEIHDRRGVVRSLNRLAMVLEDRGDWKGSQQAHERSLAGFEAIGAEISDPVQYGAFRQTSVVLYPHYARVLVKLGRPWDALLVAERSRGIGLSRLVALNGASFSGLLGPENAKSWQAASTELARADNMLRLAEERAQTQADSPEETARSVEKARALFYAAQTKASDLRDRLFGSTPALKAAQNPPPPTAAGLEALAKASPDTLFLQWMMVDKKSSLVFALSARGLEAFELNHGTEELLAVSNGWRASLAWMNGRGVNLLGQPAVRGDEPQLAKTLYDLVFSKVEPLLASGKYARLAIVGEGPLLDVPFTALMNASGDRLIDRYAISNTVSFGYLMQHPIRRKPVRSLLAVADPLATGEQRMVVPSGSRFGQLREAREEGKTVAAMYPGSVLLAGTSARETELKRLLPDFEFLHFATHGILDPGNGLRSGLLLATEPADSAEDGVLHAWEVAELSLAARLVVLSACDTGLGSERLGDGLLGVAWSFLAAGAPRVIASLWTVDDAATRELITGFYRDLNRGARIDDAMRESILRMRKNPKYASPYYWSAFDILGQAGVLQ